jgi:hypothetical protein
MYASTVAALSHSYHSLPLACRVRVMCALLAQARFTPGMSAPMKSMGPLPFKTPFNDPAVPLTFWERLPGRYLGRY